MRIVQILALMLGFSLLGMLLRARGYLRPSAAKRLNEIALTITMPAGIFLSLHHFDIAREALAAPALAAVLTLVLLGLCVLIAGALRLPASVRTVFTLTVMFGNTAFIGFPVIRAVYGPDGLARAMLIDQLGCEPLAFTLGVFLATQGAAATGLDWAVELRQLLRFPPLLTLATALLWHALGLPKLPSPVELLLQTVASATVPLVMVALGLVLRFSSLRRYWRLSLLVAVLRLVVSPALMWIACRATGQQSFARDVAAVEVGMPSMMFMLLLSLRTGLDAELCAALITATMAASLVTLPALFAILSA
jgi:predicted permease